MHPKTKAKLGQNFLVDPNAQRAIVAALGEAVHGDVVEIGPGKAAITVLLAGRAARLLAIELDRELAARLRAQFGSALSVEVLEADVLTVDLTVLARHPGRSLAVLGNLPYYITSPILQHLFTHEAVLSEAVVMVQREVAERITAVPGTRAYGLLSVLCQMYARPELLFTLPPHAFQPSPEVESAVVRMRFAPRWAELAVPRTAFTGFLQVCFAQKRKTLANNLRAAGYPPGRVEQALVSAGCAGRERAEELAPERLAELYRALA